MKKLIYSIIGLLMFAGCEDDYKTDITIPMSGIYLSSPAEGATMDLMMKVKIHTSLLGIRLRNKVPY